MAVLGVVFAAGVIRLFLRQFASGEAYPEFSSLRTDRMGTKLLFDSFGKLPGIAVERNLRPFEFLPRDGSAVLLLGLDPLRTSRNEGLLRAAEAVAARGNRVVLALHLEADDPFVTQHLLDTAERKGRNDRPSAPALKERWKVGLRLHPELRFKHRLSFAQAEGWKPVEQTDAGILAIEREFGKGTVLLMAESVDLTNGSVVFVDRLHAASRAVGGMPRVIFDEQHLGVAESGTVVGMARQFRLTGLAVGLGLCAALFIWRNASAFPPAAASGRADRLAGRTSHAGLLTLLKRHIAPDELAAVCWREWLHANGAAATADVRKQAEDVLARDGARPVEATREIHELVRRKGRS